ncbi:helix-turn-helix domain-containing protein, partial [Planomicrobium sp. CPCC 101079]|uniref:helix-turn-helix domain-containing protein n=1 Tax=Planomicrobium sp. CPCC 101079 TaxID=2599618 RepID=UPI0021057C5B
KTPPSSYVVIHDKLEVFFCMGSKKGSTKRFYPEEIKQAVIQLKLSGNYTNAEIMEIHQIKNKSQIKTWMKWYRNGETHRLVQSVGKQYSYNAELSELDELKKKVRYYEVKEELMGKYRELERRWSPPSS